jgi:uncharacterized protein (DUF433 family)
MRTIVPAFPRITVDPGVCLGKPCVRGLRIPVEVVLIHLAAGNETAQILDELPQLEAEDIVECLRFGAWLAANPVGSWLIAPGMTFAD